MLRRSIRLLLIAIVLRISWILWDGFRKLELPADVAVVLGSKVHESEQPSSSLIRRLDRALDLYRRGAVRAILVSGGVGREGHDEAQVMRAHGWQSAVAVSQYYHVPRAKLAMRQQGVPHVTGAAAEYRFTWKDPVYVLRDSVLYCMYWVGAVS